MLLILALLGAILTWLLFHHQVNHWFAVRLLLHSHSPSGDYFDQVVRESSDPIGLLKQCWATGRVTQRELVAAFLKDEATAKPSWLARADPLLLEAARDADASVRELALGALAQERSPWLFECAEAQLADADPQLRLLGLQYLRDADSSRAVPVVMRLLDDPDLRLVAGAEVALARWSGQDYGARLRMAIAPVGENRNIDPGDVETIQRAVRQRKLWWQAHAKDYPVAAPLSVPFVESARPPAPDFSLKDLAGQTVRLSDFRGRVVVLNFWATWCTACLEEIPGLVALENKVGSRVVILGVVLDSTHDTGTAVSLAAVREKVARAVKKRGINYSVLLDPRDSVGAQFNGGELPTTVILDPAGRVRRRFLGGRSLGVLELMVNEAGSKVHAE